MPGVGFTIGAIYAFVAVHDDGDEGIVAVLGPDGWVPAIAADETRLNLLRPKVEQLARNNPLVPIKLVRFDQRTDVEDI